MVNNNSVPLTPAGASITAKPNTEHSAYAEFREEWQLVSDCVDGERRVKRRGEIYLPHPATFIKSKTNKAEYDRRYTQYSSRANFLNATGRTLSGLMGIAFGKSPTYDLQPKIADFEADIDGEGNTIDQLVREAVKQNLMRGRGGILSDYINTPENTLRSPGRAILRLYTANQIINWSVTNGKMTLLVLREKNALPMSTDDFEVKLETVLREYRVIDGQVNCRVWSDGGSERFVTEGFVVIRQNAQNALEQIPFAWFGSSSNDWTVDTPPLADLAYVNIKHFINEANIAESCHLVGQPMLKLVGLSDEWVRNHLKNGIIVGSNEAVMLGQGMDMDYVQANENTMQMANAARLEKHMAMIGAKLIEKGTATKTATQAGDEAQTDNSVLSLCVSNVEAAFNLALTFMSDFQGSTGESKIMLNKQYEIATIDSAGLTSLLSAVTQGKLRMEDFIAWLQKHGIVPASDKVEDIIQELRDAAPDLEQSNIDRDNLNDDGE